MVDQSIGSISKSKLMRISTTRAKASTSFVRYHLKKVVALLSLVYTRLPHDLEKILLVPFPM